MKPKPTTTALTISVHGKDQIFTATFKHGTMSQVQKIAAKLRELVDNPYMAYIKNQDGDTVLKYKI